MVNHSDDGIINNKNNNISSNNNTAKVQEKKKILLVDDEPDILHILKKGLEREGIYEVDSYDSPKQALQNFKPNHYDLLLLDIKMPEMSGFEVYASIRKSDQRARVCFLTAFETTYHQDYVKQYFPEIKSDCYVHKPITMQNLSAKVKRILAD